MKKIIIFASGSGSNAENIITHFKGKAVECAAIFCNNPEAYVFERANKLNVHSVLFTKEEFTSGALLEKIKTINPDLIILAGFLWKIPSNIIAEYPNKIINIHPALLPKYGGKGMYGMHVHEAVKMAGDNETGITIHYVNANYDEGAQIMQIKCLISEKDTAYDIAAKIHELEFTYFPKAIEQLLG